MKSFIALNKHKLFFLFLVVAAIFITFFLFVISLTFLINDDYPELEGFIVIILTAGLVIPMFIMGIGYLGWLYNSYLRKQLLSLKSFDQLNKIGFTISYRNLNNKWAFTEETLKTELSGYQIELDTNGNAPKIIEFKVFVKPDTWDNHIEGLKRKFKKEELDIDFDGIIRKYDVKKLKHLTIEQLKLELIEFVEAIRVEGFQPAEK